MTITRLAAQRARLATAPFTCRSVRLSRRGQTNQSPPISTTSPQDRPIAPQCAQTSPGRLTLSALVDSSARTLDDCLVRHPFVVRELTALVTGPSEDVDSESAVLYSGVLSIGFREASFEPRIERIWTGEAVAAVGRVVQRAPNIVLPRLRVERVFKVLPLSLGCWLVLIEDRDSELRRTARVRLVSRYQRWKVRRALRAGGFQIDEPRQNEPPGTTTLWLDID